MLLLSRGFTSHATPINCITWQYTYSSNILVESLCRMNSIEQAPTYLDQTALIEQLLNEVGPAIDREIDEVGELLQIVQEQLTSFHIAGDLTNLQQQAAIQQALDDCASARAIQVRLATFISCMQTLK
jgi:hypothetical protein